MNFYKILNEEETHHSLKYHDGLNVDPLEFNPSGYCEPGGIYFAREDILAFLDYGPWIRKVTLPEGEPIYESPGYPKKWKAKKVILGPRRKIDLQVIEELVEKGVDIHVNNDYALRWAANYGHLDVVKFLVEKGANIHADNNGALRWVAESGHLEVVKFLIRKGANIHAEDDYALKWAARYGHLETVKFLVENGANIHAEDDYALKWAANHGHLEVVKFLIRKGANIYAKDNYALKRAAKNGHLETVKFLVEKGADIHAEDDSALRWPAENGRLDVVKYLVSKGVDIHVNNDAALRQAARNGYLEIVKYLLEKGADIHVGNDGALRWAANRGYLEVVKFLVEKGANIHADNDYALRWAAENGYLGVVRYLIRKSADISTEDDTLELAMLDENNNVGKFLVEQLKKSQRKEEVKMFDYKTRRKELNKNYTVRELRQMCVHSYGISGVSKLRKNQIIDKILEYKARKLRITEIDFGGISILTSEQPKEFSTIIYVSCSASSNRYSKLVGRKVLEISNFFKEALNIELNSIPFVNGKEASMDYVLKHGDIVELIKQTENQLPRRQAPRFVPEL